MVQSKLPNQILHFTSCNVFESIIKDDRLHFWGKPYDCILVKSLLMRLPVVFFVKCEERSIEEELRYVRIRERNMHASYSKEGGIYSYLEDTNGVKCRENNGKQIYYLDILFPKSSLEGILIGKQLDLETTEEAIKTLLQQTGYKNIFVEQLMY